MCLDLDSVINVSITINLNFILFQFDSSPEFMLCSLQLVVGRSLHYQPKLQYCAPHFSLSINPGVRNFSFQSHRAISGSREVYLYPHTYSFFIMWKRYILVLHCTTIKRKGKISNEIIHLQVSKILWNQWVWKKWLYNFFCFREPPKDLGTGE